MSDDFEEMELTLEEIVRDLEKRVDYLENIQLKIIWVGCALVFCMFLMALIN